MTKNRKIATITLCLAFALVAAVFGFGMTIKASAAFSEPEECITVYTDSIEDTVISSYNYGRPESVTCGQSPIDFVIPQAENNPRITLRQGTHYSYNSQDGTVTLKSSLLSELGEGMYWLNFVTGNGDIEYCLDIRGESKWVLNSEKGSIAEAGNNTVLNLNGYTGNYGTDGRVRYSDGLDVKKPIRFAVQNLDMGMGNWIMLALHSNPYASEYMNETDKTPGVVKVLDMAVSATSGERERVQGFAGFVYSTGTKDISYCVSHTNLNVFEFYIGEKPEESYVSVNGHNTELPSEVSRGDFPDGLAYFSIYAAEGDMSFAVASDLEAPMAYFNATVPEKAYTLKTDTDVKALVVNASGDLSVSYKGTALTSEQYGFDAQTGLLTIFGSYLKTLAYDKEFVFTLECNGHASDVRVITALTGEASAGVKAGDSDIKYFEQKDITFDVDLKGETFVRIIDSADGETVDGALASFSNGKITFSASGLSALGNGTYVYLAETSESIFPLYIIKENFTYGIADKKGDSDYDVSCAKLTVNGEADLTAYKLINLGSAVEYKLDIKSTGGYYLNGTAGGDKDSYIQLDFTDMITGNILTVRVRANAAADNGASRYKTWADFVLTDSDGENITTATHVFSRDNTVGEHTLRIERVDDKFRFTLNGGSAATVSAENTLSDSLQLSVKSTRDYSYTLYNAGVDYSKLEKAVRNAKDKNSAAYNAALHLAFDSTQAEVNAAAEAVKQKGCGSNLNVTLPLIAATLLALAAVILAVRKKRKVNA